MSKGWIGVDLDGTLARYDQWGHHTEIGAPIPIMVRRVRGWLAEGKDVRILTARVAVGDKKVFSETVKAIREWCVKHLGEELIITCCKDMQMTELWDDRAVQVVPNTGLRATEEAYECGRDDEFDRLMDKETV